MQRQISLLLVAVLCATILAACGAATPNESPQSTTAPARQNPPAAATTAPASAPSQAAAATAAPAAPAGALAPSADQSQQEPVAGGVAVVPAIIPDLAPPLEAKAPIAAPPEADEEIYDSTFFKNYGTNPFFSTANDPQSTFAMDVDTASYGVMRRYLSDNNLPDPDSVRVEEYLNYFNYEYPQPETSDFAIYTEAAPSTFGGGAYEMVQIGIQARTIESAARKPAALTFVIDVSGSMAREDRLDTVKQALALLVEELRADDTIAIAVYGTEARAVLDVTSGADKATILAAINNLQSEGSTNVQAGLRVGFGLADEAFKADGINMLLLCSDGVANSGVTDPAQLIEQYRSYFDQGVQLSTYGFGMGNFNDVTMEVLANQGNGAYAYIDTLDEAERVFVQNLTSTLQTIARDAKIQVEFDPAVVGAGHSVTALYEIKRFPGAEGNVATIRIRYEKPDGNVVEEAQTLTTSSIRAAVADTTPRFKLAASVAQYAELLRHSQWAKGQALEDVIGLAQQAARGFNNNADVTEFFELLTHASDLAPATR